MNHKAHPSFFSSSSVWKSAVVHKLTSSTMQTLGVSMAPCATVVAIYCHEYGQTWWPAWGPSSLATNGLGGAEEAVVFVARELVTGNVPWKDYSELKLGRAIEKNCAVAFVRRYDVARTFPRMPNPSASV